MFSTATDRVAETLAASVGCELVIVDEAGLSRLSGTRSPRGPVAVIEIPPPGDRPRAGLLVAWAVSDPGNVGTMIRIAAAFDWGYGYTPGTADPWSPKVLRSAAGAHFGTSLQRVSKVEEIQELGFQTVATVVRHGRPPDELEAGRYAVLIGEEAAGLPSEVVAACSQTVTIPMPGGTESLNAAVAAAIVVYEIAG